MRSLALAAFLALAASDVAHAATCTTTGGHPPPTTDASGWAQVHVCANDAGGGGGGTPVGPYTYTPLGYQQITLTAATHLTVPTGATIAFITVETQNARYRDDGTAPTATVGQPLVTTQQLVYSGSLSAIQFINVVAGAILDVSYYK